MVQAASAVSEVAIPTTRLSDSDLAEIKSFDDAVNLLGQLGAEIRDFNDFGSGFVVVDEKDRLIGVPFLILEWRFNNGTFGEFVSCAIVTDKNEKLILNDGSTGISEQLREITSRIPSQKGLVVRGGLSRSDYTYKDDKGKDIPASTYYLANAS